MDILPKPIRNLSDESLAKQQGENIYCQYFCEGQEFRSCEPCKVSGRCIFVTTSERKGIELVIGHLKEDYRLCRNYYKGIVGDEINVMLAAAGFNFKGMMNK